MPATHAPSLQPVHDIDLLIKGGTVIDPAQNLHVVADVALADGKVLAVAPDISEGRARKVVFASGSIVTPGWIDLHVHCYDGLTAGLNADLYGLMRGTTTVVDAGSCGHLLIDRFIRDIVDTTVTRVYALVHLAAIGPVTELRYAQDHRSWVDPMKAAEAAIRNRGPVVGIKVHLQTTKSTKPQEREMEFTRRALEAAEMAGLPLMAHINETHYPLKDHLDLMRRGDVFTHCFNDYVTTRPLTDDGKVRPEMWAARDRGVVFDVAMSHDHPHFRFAVAQQCIDDGFLPDTISSDNNNDHATEDVYDLPTTVSKFLALGLDIDKAIELVTIKPAQVFDYGVQIGTLKPGSEADVAIFDLVAGHFRFADGSGDTRTGTQMIINKAVVCRGRLFASRPWDAMSRVVADE